MTNPNRRIIIADDHPAIRRGLRNLLETHPYYQVVGEAGDGRSALELAREKQPDIAIVAYSLSQLNGLNLSYALKREFPKIEILVYTMHDRDEIIMEVLRGGVRGFVLKSDPETYLIAALDALSMKQSYFSPSISHGPLDPFLTNNRHETVRRVTSRERQVVQCVAEGRTNKEIDQRLIISVKTVESHRAHAMEKLNLKTIADLVRYAVRNQLVQP